MQIKVPLAVPAMVFVVLSCNGEDLPSKQLSTSFTHKGKDNFNDKLEKPLKEHLRGGTVLGDKVSSLQENPQHDKKTDMEPGSTQQMIHNIEDTVMISTNIAGKNADHLTDHKEQKELVFAAVSKDDNDNKPFEAQKVSGFGYVTSQATSFNPNRKFSKKKKKRVKEEIAKSQVDACNNGIRKSNRMYCVFPHPKNPCHCSEETCLPPHNKFSLSKPDRWQLVDNYCSGYDFRGEYGSGDDVRVVCYNHCNDSQFHQHSCFAGISSTVYCTQDAQRCHELASQQWWSVIGFLSNVIPVSKVLGAFKVAASGKTMLQKRALFKKMIKDQATKLFNEMKQEAKKELRSLMRDLSDEDFDEILLIALEDLTGEEMQREDPSIWEEVAERAEDFLRAVDVIGIYDLADAFVRKPCSDLRGQTVEPDANGDDARTSGNPNAYWNAKTFDYDFNEEVATLWNQLGWNAWNWEEEDNTNWPASYYTEWNDLSDVERSAASSLGYSPATWDVVTIDMTPVGDWIRNDKMYHMHDWLNNELRTAQSKWDRPFSKRWKNAEDAARNGINTANEIEHEVLFSGKTVSEFAVYLGGEAAKYEGRSNANWGINGYDSEVSNWINKEIAARLRQTEAGCK